MKNNMIKLMAVLLGLFFSISSVAQNDVVWEGTALYTTSNNLRGLEQNQKTVVDINECVFKNDYINFGGIYDFHNYYSDGHNNIVDEHYILKKRGEGNKNNGNYYYFRYSLLLD